jgi:hypothetical protein
LPKINDRAKKEYNIHEKINGACLKCYYNKKGMADYYFVRYIGEPLSGVLTIQYATPSLKHAVVIPVLEKRCNLIVLHLPLASLAVIIITVKKKRFCYQIPFLKYCLS